MSGPIRFDWRELISPPFMTCPACKNPELGTASIGNGFVAYRCRSCGRGARERLPQLRKTLVYLDQMAPSNIAKALDPVWRTKRGAQDPYWLELFDLLDRLLKLNLLLCPTSPVHEKESSVTPYDKGLQRLNEHLAGGVHLEYPELILANQLHAALPAYLENATPDFSRVHRRHVLSGSPDDWLERLSISVNVPSFPGEASRRRKLRDAAHDAFVNGPWKRWQAEVGRSFDDWYKEERSALPEVHLTLYDRWVAAFIMAGLRVGPLGEDVLNPRLEVDVVNGLIAALKDAGFNDVEARRRVREFLASEQALGAPMNEIRALLFAAMARKAASGQKRPPSRGMWNDVQAVSAYLPYVDAMFVDDQVAGLLREEPLRTRLSGYAQVFSNRTRDEFLQYLRDLERAASEEHVKLVERIYGERWLTPYREILEHEREQQGPAE